MYIASLLHFLLNLKWSMLSVLESQKSKLFQWFKCTIFCVYTGCILLVSFPNIQGNFICISKLLGILLHSVFFSYNFQMVKCQAAISTQKHQYSLYS
jgi:hypothetical protein